jgi:hypothetical protein
MDDLSYSGAGGGGTAGGTPELSTWTMMVVEFILMTLFVGVRSRRAINP